MSQISHFEAKFNCKCCHKKPSDFFPKLNLVVIIKRLAGSLIIGLILQKVFSKVTFTILLLFKDWRGICSFGTPMAAPKKAQRELKNYFQVCGVSNLVRDPKIRASNPFKESFKSSTNT